MKKVYFHFYNGIHYCRGYFAAGNILSVTPKELDEINNGYLTITFKD
jgi:hypothetical protein